MRIAVIGAGGVGGYYGAILARAGHDVALVARGEHLEAIRAHGVRVKLPDGRELSAAVRASEHPGELGDADLVVVAVKAWSLPDVAPAIAALAREGAIVLPLLNGVDVHRRLASAGVPEQAILAGLTYISAARTAPGVVERRSSFQTILVGEPGGAPGARARRVVDAFADTDVEVQLVDDIETQLWRKLAFIASLAAVCGLSRAPIGAVRDAPGGRELIRRAVSEVVAVAAARGAAMADEEAEEIAGRIFGLDPGLRPSLLLDLEAGGPTEVDILSGAVSRLGAEAGVATPVHDVARTALAAAVGEPDGTA